MLISLKQLDNVYGKRKSSYVKKSLTTTWQLTSVWILSAELPAKIAKTELNKILFDRTTNRRLFSRCVYRSVIPLNIDFSC